MSSQPVVMGVLNVTPDSFSDGGRYVDPTDALAHALFMRDAGTQLIDVGGESTRPGATRVSEEVELARVVPTLKALIAEGLDVSIDTTRASVARKAIELGARTVNDVSGGKADSKMLPLIADTGVTYILTHWRAPSIEMDSHTHYDDVARDVADELCAQIEVARAHGVVGEQLIIDPGLGFSKTSDQNWQVLAHLPHLVNLGYRVLIGASRKRFLNDLMPGFDDRTLGADQSPSGTKRAAATNDFKDQIGAAIAAYAVSAGVWGVRTHDPVGVLRVIRAGMAD